MKILKKLKNLFKKDEVRIIEDDCLNDEYCPLYLSYVDKYGKYSNKVHHCKNSNEHYCTKYRLIEENEWYKLNMEQKLKIIEVMNLIHTLDKEYKF